MRKIWRRLKPLSCLVVITIGTVIGAMLVSDRYAGAFVGGAVGIVLHSEVMEKKPLINRAARQTLIIVLSYMLVCLGTGMLIGWIWLNLPHGLLLGCNFFNFLYSWVYFQSKREKM